MLLFLQFLSSTPPHHLCILSSPLKQLSFIPHFHFGSAYELSTFIRFPYLTFNVPVRLDFEWTAAGWEPLTVGDVRSPQCSASKSESLQLFPAQGINHQLRSAIPFSFQKSYIEAQSLMHPLWHGKSNGYQDDGGYSSRALNNLKQADRSIQEQRCHFNTVPVQQAKIKAKQQTKAHCSSLVFSWVRGTCWRHVKEAVATKSRSWMPSTPWHEMSVCSNYSLKLFDIDK